MYAGEIQPCLHTSETMYREERRISLGLYLYSWQSSQPTECSSPTPTLWKLPILLLFKGIAHLIIKMFPLFNHPFDIIFFHGTQGKRDWGFQVLKKDAKTP